MRISDWSSDVCSSDLKSREYGHHCFRLVNCRTRRWNVHMLVRHFASFNAAIPNGGNPVIDRIKVDRQHQDGVDPRWHQKRVLIFGPGGCVRSQCSRTRSEEHQSELKSLMRISYAF